MKKLLLFLTFLVAVCQFSYAQSHTVTGNVVDMDGFPLVGATIIDKSSGQGTYTDQDGVYSLKTSGDATLVARYLGYVDLEVAVNGITTLNFTMQSDAHQLDEVVVIGYGTTKASKTTGAISSVSSGELLDYPATNFATSMAGKVTGLQVSQDSGTPGAAPTIRVRGIGTLTAGSDPLIVVDGFPLTEGSSLNSINTASIESIQVLKDAASTAIYGSRGANGVIMITTKGGRRGKPMVTATANFGIQTRMDGVELVDAYDYAQFLLEARNTGYVNKDPQNRSELDDNAHRVLNGASARELLPDYIWPYINGETGLTNTDWYSHIFRPAPTQDYNVNVRGGGEHANYAITGGYQNQEGIIIGTDFQKVSANIKTEIRPTDNIRFGASLSPSHTIQNTTQSSNTWGGTIVSLASISYPFFSPYNADGSLSISEQIFANQETDGALTENPLAWATMLTNQTKSNRVFGNAYMDIDFFDKITYKLNVGMDYQGTNYEFFKPSTLGQYRIAAGESQAMAASSFSENLNVIIENTLNYQETFGGHDFQALLGQSYQQEDFRGLRTDALGFTDNSIPNVAGGSNFSVTASQSSWTMISYFSRLNYGYADKYLLSGSVRWDGSSRFGANSKWGLFPAVSGAWVVSNEDFLKGSKVLENAKLRVSWGVSGNNQIPNYGALAVMNGSSYVDGQAIAPGVVIGTAPNQNLSWEKTSTINAGVDFSLWKYLGVSDDFYVATTNDLLMSVPVPEQSGYSTSLQNIGSVRNTGVEISLSTARPLKVAGIQWNSTLNASYNRDKVLALADGQTQIISGQNITQVGGRVGELYGYEVTGIYKSQEELDSSPNMAGTQIGDWIIADLNCDGQITTADKKSYGSPAADVILGWSNSLEYKGFTLSFDLYAELGKMKNSGTMASLESGEGFMMITQNYFDNRYHAVNNPDGTYATPNMANYSSTRKQAASSNIFFQDASYLSLRSLKLAYNMPTRWTKSLGISSGQIYAMGNNLFVVTKYDGFSVEADNSTSVLEQGVEKYSYPMTRTISLGLNFTF